MSNPEVKEVQQNEKTSVSYERPEVNVDWQGRIDTVLDTFKTKEANPDLNKDDLKTAEKWIAEIPASEFLKRNPKDLRTLFLIDGKVDFYGNEAAAQYVGAGDLFPNSQKFLKIDGVMGRRSIGRKVGYVDRSGDYLAIYGGVRGKDLEEITLVSEEEGIEFFGKDIDFPSEKDELEAKEKFKKDVEIMEKEEEDLIQAGAEPLKGSALLSNPDFSKKLDEVCGNLGIERSWLEKVMWKESGVNTKIVNKIGAVGLIQFIPNTAGKLGTSTGELRMMSGVEQLDYVEEYFNSYKGQIYSVEDLYLVTFYPKALGKPDDFVIGSEESDEHVKLVAEQNPSISQGREYATKADIKRFINA